MELHHLSMTELSEIATANDINLPDNLDKWDWIRIIRDHFRKPIQISTSTDLDFESSELNGLNVTFKHHVQQLHGIAGCPMGRGVTVTEATADLKRRTEIESPVAITFSK